MECCKTIKEYETKKEKLKPTILKRCSSTGDIDFKQLKKINKKYFEMFKSTSKFY